MPDEVQDVAGDSSTPDVTAAPSAEGQEAPQQAVVQQTAEEQRVPLERFQAVIQEKQRLQEEKAQRVAMLQRPVQVMQQPAQPAATDPWDGLVNHVDPATAQFYQRMQQVVRAERFAGKQDAIQELSPVIQAGMTRLAELDIRDFRRDNPEIKAGSDQEKLVVSYMNGQMDGVRHTLESAKRNALFDGLQEENRTLKSKQQAVPKKVVAGQVESSSGIPQVSGMPKPVQTTSDVVSQVVRQGGSMMDAAKAIFG